MDRQFRVTDDVCEQDMGNLELNFLFNLSSHMDSHGNTPRKNTLKQAAESREESPRKNRCASQRCLAHLHSSRLFFQIIVPVVQRIEQGFPKGKTSVLQELANVISNMQTAVCKPVE